jgi:4-cresol dehydrogenase (hydroxylating)
MNAYCGLEVVLANGDVLRTGIGRDADNRSWHVYKRGSARRSSQLFMQSNYGIVTKMGVWLMPWPECYMPLWLRVWKRRRPRADRRHAARLMLDRTIENVPQIWNTICDGVGDLEPRAVVQGDDPIPDDVIDHMARELEIGRWIDALRALRRRGGRRPRFAKIKAAFERIPARRCGARSTRRRHGDARAPVRPVQAGVPNLDINQMTGWYGGEEGGHIGFSPFVRRTGQDRCRCRQNHPAAWSSARRGSNYRASLIPTNARSFIPRTMVTSTQGQAQAPAPYELEDARRRSGEGRGTAEYQRALSTSWTWRRKHNCSRPRRTGGSSRRSSDAVDPNGGSLSPGKQLLAGRSMPNGKR